MMAPTRKSRSVNRRYSSINEVSPIKERESAKKGISRKRKLTDMLGPGWGSEELVSFYDAYRKHGKDWKKVAAALTTRSCEMVEALYSMNKAYLSLPHGTASAPGLSAMMVDHYSNLEGNDSDEESTDGVASSRKAQKHARGKTQQNSLKAASYEQNVLSSPSLGAAASNLGILSFLKKKRSGGKRTPRVPVSFSNESTIGQKCVSPSRQGMKLKADDNVAHEIAVALAGASQKGGTPEVSHTPSKRVDNSPTSSPFRWKHQRKNYLSETANERDLERISEAAGAAELSRYNPSTKESTRSGAVRSKGKKTVWKKFEFDGNNGKMLDDIGEECRGTEESHRFGGTRAIFDSEVTDSKNYRSSLQSHKRKKKDVLFTKDESTAFDALQTLADLSLMMPSENEDGEGDNVLKSTPSETLHENRLKEKRRQSGVKSKGEHSMSSFEIASDKSSKLSTPVPKADLLQSPAKTTKRKQRVPTRKTTVHQDTNSSESPGMETGDVGKLISNRPSQSGLPKLVKNSEKSVNNDVHKEPSNSAQSSLHVPDTKQDNLPTKVRSRRKMTFSKPETTNDSKILDKLSIGLSNLPVASNSDPSFNTKKYLGNCLSNPRHRRWCTYEWFYSAIDYSWFAKKEFFEYLNHVGLGHVPTLTRVEWGVIRSSLCKPRRFSEHFLRDEKVKLNMYRESVRKQYTELREGLPTDLERPLLVGQRVVAIHPKTREIHDGSVLTVDHSRCRVQFDWPELGVEFVKDIDCMPFHPLENMPALPGRQVFYVDKLLDKFNELKVYGRAQEYVKLVEDRSESDSRLSPLSNPRQSKATTKILVQPANDVTYPQVVIPLKEADVQALAVLTRALDKKEAIIMEMRHLNDEVMANHKGVDKGSEQYKKQYAAVLIQLNEANEQVSSALYFLRQRNAYPAKNTALVWQRPVSYVVDLGRLSGFLDRPVGQTLDAGSHANEIIESSRIKARAMLAAAIKATSTLTSKEERIQKMEDAIDYVNEQLPSDDTTIPAETESKSKDESDLEAQIPSDLISNCVATLLMIRKCTERHFPPSDVAQILDSAATSLEPRSPQNLPVYTEIQKCMGIIRNQIMALIPTST